MSHDGAVELFSRDERRAMMGGSLAIIPKAELSPDNSGCMEGRTLLTNGLRAVSPMRGSLHPEDHQD